MARSFDDTQLEYLRINTAVSTVYGLAMVCWFKADDVTGGYCLMSIMDRFNDEDTIALYAQGAVGGDPVRFQLREGVGAWKIADTTAGYTAGTWTHACGIYAGVADRRVLINGGNKGTDVVGNCYPSVNATAIGVLYRPGIVSYMSGLIAEAAVYNTLFYPGATYALRADYFETNILPSLAAGYSPLFYPYGLTAYWSLMSEDSGVDKDIVGGFNLTPINTPTFDDHPRVIMPQRSQLTEPGGVIPAHGKLKNECMLSGKLKQDSMLSGKLRNEPYTTGKLGTYTGD